MNVTPEMMVCEQHGPQSGTVEWSNSVGYVWCRVVFDCGCSIRNADAPENAAWMRENYPDFQRDHRDAP